MDGSAGSRHPNNENGGPHSSTAQPESTMALDFSSALDGAFNLDADIARLGSNVQEKKEAVRSQSQELEELEARLKATEERLKKAGVQQTPASTGQQEMRTGQAASSTAHSSGSAPPSRVAPGRAGTLAAESSSLSDRAPTPLNPRNEPMPGAMPETPTERQAASDYYDQRRS